MPVTTYVERELAAAEEGYAPFSKVLNGGDRFAIATELSHEHPYLLDKLVAAAAIAVLTRTYEDSLCTEKTVFDDAHPEHDGRLACGTVIGALRMLAVRSTDDVLAQRKFWVGTLVGYRGDA